MFHGLWYLACHYLLPWVVVFAITVYALAYPDAFDDFVPGDEKLKYPWRKLIKNTSEWIKSWLKPALHCLEDLVYQMDTLKYCQWCYRQGYQLWTPTSQGRPKFLPPIIWYILLSRWNKVNQARELCLLLYALNTKLSGHKETDKGPPMTPQQVQLNSDSFSIGVDNRATREYLTQHQWLWWTCSSH